MLIIIIIIIISLYPSNVGDLALPPLLQGYQNWVRSHPEPFTYIRGCFDVATTHAGR